MATLFLFVARTPREVANVKRVLRGESHDPSLFSDLPGIWIGKASWRKADLFGDPEPYVPAAVRVIESVIGSRLPVVDEVLIEHVRHALQTTNTTRYPQANVADVVTFLDARRGHRAFTVRQL